ncbi:MAG: Malate dehydrogenase (EC, partial [uncultured Sulfurovum sp.]
KLGYGAGQTGALVIGDHGQNMIPLPQKVQVGDVPTTDLLTDEEFQEIIERTKGGGAEIVKHLGTSGYYGPGRAIAHMVEAILNDSRTVVSCSVLLNGEYGYSNVTVGVPVVLGQNGVEEIIQMTLNTKTREKFQTSVDSIQEGINILEKNGFFDS